jgi:hypothetical protein
MTVLMTQEERNHKAAAISEMHVRTISELGFTVDRGRDANGCFGVVALDAPRREYTLADGTKIRGPIPGDLPELNLREHFADELKRANRVAEQGSLAKKALAAALSSVLAVGLAISLQGQHDLLYVTVEGVPVETPDQPHGHNESSSGAPSLIGRVAEEIFSNVTATTTTNYTARIL